MFSTAYQSIDNQSKFQMLTLFFGRHIGVPRGYTKMADPYMGSVNFCKTFRLIYDVWGDIKA